MIHRKDGAELASMARAGAVVAQTHQILAEALRPGTTTRDLDDIAERTIIAAGATPSFKGYRGFPATLCTSRNDQVVHGIPSAEVVLDEGDLISIDCGAIVEGFHADSAVTLIVGDPHAAPAGVTELIDATRTAMWAGIAQARKGRRLGDIGAAIGASARRHRYGLVTDYIGHGVGRSLHEDPAVANDGEPGRGMRLPAGLVIAIEPMFNLGAAATRVMDDGWTVATTDGAWSAHWEHTVAVTADGPWILTARSGEPSRL
ncbi:MAG: type I methionyl aminopeptidase [Nitriliruptoraceae bacterium]